MSTKKLIGILLLIGSFNCSSDSNLVVTPGIGTGTLQVGITKVKAALSILGNDYQFEELESPFDDGFVENLYTYPKLRLTIISHVDMYKADSQDLDHAIIVNIIFEKAAQTNSGLEIGKSSKQDAIAIYGQPEEQDTTCITYIHYRTKGISFKIDPFTNKIIAFDVYVKHNYPDITCEGPWITPEQDCDSFTVDMQAVKDYKKAWEVFLETTSLEWFLENRQSIWREAKAWNERIVPVDSNSMIKCLCESKKEVFLYIPHRFYLRKKNGNEYFRFYLVNNSRDTVAIPCMDDVVDHISSSVSYNSGHSADPKWLSFQKTGFATCGNSYWTMKLAPGTAIESNIESDNFGLGSEVVDYRLELNLDSLKIVSNSIKIKLMTKQLPYLGSKFD